MPKRPYEWRVHSHGCYQFDNATLGLRPRDQSAHLLVFLHLRTANVPGPSSIMRSEQSQQRRFERRHNKERMQRRRSRSRSCLPRPCECFFSHTSEVACEPFASQLFLISALTHGRFGSSLCLCLCLCLSLHPAEEALLS